MRIEDIGEAIGVVASFSGGRATPLEFRWGGRRYPVEAVNARWIDRAGDAYSLHYSVQSGSETYFLHFQAADVQWRLDRVAMDG